MKGKAVFNKLPRCESLSGCGGAPVAFSLMSFRTSRSAGGRRSIWTLALRKVFSLLICPVRKTSPPRETCLLKLSEVWQGGTGRIFHRAQSGSLLDIANPKETEH